jgi:hypothetical protein
VGPPVIGFLTDHIGRPETLALLVAAALAVAALGGRAVHTGDSVEADTGARYCVVRLPSATALSSIPVTYRPVPGSRASW